MTGKSLKWLRTLHIISASIWLGATVCIGMLTVICFFSLNEAEFLTMAPFIPELYRTIILPIALFIILQGIIYGFFTKWGFFKHRWVLLKWMLVLLLVPCIGVGAIGHLFSVIEKVNTLGFTGGLADGGRVLLFIALQIIIMLIMIGISVFKPILKKA
jgi:hypothetical protein